MLINNYALIAAPFGAIAITVTDGELAIELSAGQAADDAVNTREYYDPLLSTVCKQILSYLQDPARVFYLSLQQRGTPFQQRVWRAIAEIPAGEVRTYGQIAAAIGSGPRAVANACGANNLPLVIPCHRVVGSAGLGGFMQGKANGLFIKRWLLTHEGVLSTGLQYA